MLTPSAWSGTRDPAGLLNSVVRESQCGNHCSGTISLVDTAGELC